LPTPKHISFCFSQRLKQQSLN